MIGLVFLALLLAATSTAFFTRGIFATEVEGVRWVHDLASVAMVGLKAHLESRSYCRQRKATSTCELS